MTLTKNEYKQMAITAALACDSKKAENVKVLDLCGKSVLAEFIVMSVIESSPQLEAVQQAVEDNLKKEGHFCLHRDGMQSKNWRVMDYGGVIIHTFDKQAADFYAIEKIYTEAQEVNWEKVEEEKAEKKTTKKPAAKKTTTKKTVVKKASSKTKKTTASEKKPSKKTLKK